MEPGSSIPLKATPMNACDTSDCIVEAIVPAQAPSSFICDICAFSTAHPASLRRHMETHGTRILFKCEIDGCDKIYRRRYDLGCHIKMAHQDESGTCQYCAKQFLSRRGLKEHEERHAGLNKTFQCDSCCMVFERKSKLEGHVNDKHRHYKPHRCPNVPCNRAYAHRGSLEAHSKECRHGEKPKQFKCDSCTQIFHMRSVLLDHKNAKHSVKSYTCPCGKSFQWRSNLSRHRKKEGHI